MESHRLFLGIVIVSVLVLALSLGRPSITGFVPTDTFTQSLDIDVSESQRFNINSDSRILSFALSGETMNGLVNIYLTDGVSNWLVYTNKHKQSSAMNSITGMASLDISPAEKLNKIESLPDGYTVSNGVFQNDCIETCVLNIDDKELFLDVVLEPGASLHISGITFASG